MLSQYERVKQIALALARKNKIKDFSSEEIYRVFKRAKEQVLYASILRIAIEEGLTIASLYEDERIIGHSKNQQFR